MTQPSVRFLRDGSGVCLNCQHKVEDHHRSKASQGCLVCNCTLTRPSFVPRMEGSLACRILDDGRLAVLYRLLFGYRIVIGPFADYRYGGDEAIEYRRPEEIASDEMMVAHFWDWDGYGAPVHWYRSRSGNEETINPMFADTNKEGPYFVGPDPF